ncbi:hypothetical protein ASPWEDRAFT_174946 [Aspergillus wentii DTO 134E9]|uniref:Zn(2)-C6 fungal-type domain-containing protein n=1 Tax=Aspergillus wentii DTO 134E9 TaxID=1073089 RepID=A0A1L9RF44_ASPWE|nr:uncharacterized protein ASPWEDRAFT_174946 [Aspergillus wentii DTO 134E9]KAI9926216.1 hypothetical protein MW887_004679 [Aspergillus wentii]OJJ33542.1 hypothetical protein ASPWEDRAFT_174946 [Aspergillus wentii DTO 134E9]
MTSQMHSTQGSSPTKKGIRRKAPHACDRCKMKKTKCDGDHPCTRCRAGDYVCVFSRKKVPREKVCSKGYVQLLEQQNYWLIRGFYKLYAQLHTDPDRPGEHPGERDNKRPSSLHQMLANIGIIEDDGSPEPSSDIIDPELEPEPELELEPELEPEPEPEISRDTSPNNSPNGLDMISSVVDMEPPRQYIAQLYWEDRSSQEISPGRFETSFAETIDAEYDRKIPAPCVHEPAGLPFCGRCQAQPLHGDLDMAGNCGIQLSADYLQPPIFDFAHAQTSLEWIPQLAKY